ncbi:hypothetical protein GCM10022389_18970 [Flavobacterium cheonanense]|jgi:hypothetical protein|uniref:Lipoprotein n=1 Tax=Flavobacterium cheonanense TaxID=706183 RepID=A0ABP7VSS9_9FLAO
MKSKILLFSTALVLFFGCSSPSKNLKTSYSEINNEGMIVGTICIENKTYSGYTFVYTDDLPAVADYANQSNEITYKNSSGDFREKGKTYFLFSIVKPEGKYKFAKIKIYDNTRERQSEFVIPLNHKFVVEKGKTTYYGQLTINTQEKKYTVENNLDRDKEWFKKKAPQIQF